MTASRSIIRLASLGLSLALAGCSLPSLNLFGGDNTGSVPPPENATQYRCANNASFYLRSLSDGAMWVIYNDRQIRLDKDEANPKRFTNGIAVLEMDGASVTLSDGPQINYSA